MRNAFVAAVLVAVMSLPALASVDRKVMQVEAIRTQQSEIRAGVESRSGRYKALSADTRGELLNKQAALLRLIDGKQSTDDLNEHQKTEVFNTLEWIEAALNNAEDERMICEHRPILGSSRKERVCKSVKQIREERERAQTGMSRSQPPY